MRLTSILVPLKYTAMVFSRQHPRRAIRVLANPQWQLTLSLVCSLRILPTPWPAEQGINFGFQYSVNSTPKGKPIRIRSIIRFPEPGLVSPRGKVYKESVEHKEVKIGHRSLHGYGFDEPWEIVLGEWVFEVWYNKARLIRKTFTIELPVALPVDEGLVSE